MINLTVRLVLKAIAMDTVRDILQIKGKVVYTVSPDSSVYDALETLEDKNLGALVVVERNGKLDGIFTERDYARKVILKGRSSKETLVRDIMTDSPVFVTPDTKIEECMQLMTNKFIRHLPVLENGELVGIISIGDVVKHIINQKDFIIQNLEHYIVS
jgi:CBS domain-containing protein